MGLFGQECGLCSSLWVFFFPCGVRESECEAKKKKRVRVGLGINVEISVRAFSVLHCGFGGKQDRFRYQKSILRRVL